MGKKTKKQIDEKAIEVLNTGFEWLKKNNGNDEQIKAYYLAASFVTSRYEQ